MSHGDTPKVSKTPKVFFSKTKVAREKIAEQAEVTYHLYMKAIEGAMKAGKYTEAMAALQWLMLHAPAGDDGVTLIDTNLDTKKVTEGTGGPKINIGFNLGGVPQSAKALPEPAIDVDISDVDEDDEDDE